VTRRGRAVETLGPAKKKAWKSLEGILAGKGRIVGDIIHTDFEYDCLSDNPLI